MTLSQHIARVCLFLFAAIAILGGILQMYLGEPETTPRLDNIHRFLAGIYLGSGFISLWAAITIQKQARALVVLIALGGFLGGIGRLVSMKQVGTPEPQALWLTYLSLEIVIPLILLATQWRSDGSKP